MAYLQGSRERRHIDYDDAHQTAANCSEKFPSCTESIWNAGFLIEITKDFNNEQLIRANILKTK